MSETINIISVFLVGILASFIGSIAGSGALLIIPFLIFIGLPPQAAIATNKMGTVGTYIGSTPKFFKAKKILWKYVPLFMLLSLIGAYVGANALLTINEDILMKMTGAILLLMLPTLFIGKEFGVKQREVTRRKKIIGYVLFLLVMIFAGFFGGGATTLTFCVLTTFFGLTINQANGTTTIPWLALSLLALTIFAINGIVDYYLGTSLFLGTVIGGRLGAHTAIRKGNEWVRLILMIVLLISGIKFLFF